MLGHEPSATHTFKSVMNFIIFTIALVVGTILLVQFSQGYRYDFSTGGLQEFGRLQILTPQDGVPFSINGGEVFSTTPYEENVAVGNYSVVFDSDEFRTWQTQLYVPVGRIRTIDNVLLLPNELNFELHTTLRNAIFSPNRTYYLQLSDGGLAIGGVTEEREPRVVAVSDSPTAIQRSIWSSDNQRAVLYFTNEADEIVSLIQVDMRSRQVVAEYNAERSDEIVHVFNQGDIAFKDSEGRVFIENTNNERQFSLPDSEEYIFSGSRVIYAVSGGNTYEVFNVGTERTTTFTPLRSSADQTIITAFDRGSSLYLVYKSGDYTRLVANADQQASELVLPRTLKRATPAPNGSRILIKTDKVYQTFAIDEREFTKLDIPLANDSINWLDSYRLQFTLDGTQEYVVEDYTGFNRYEVGTEPVILPTDRRDLYRIQFNDETVTIERAQLLE